jgi:HK97 family phage prohead protease
MSTMILGRECMRDVRLEANTSSFVGRAGSTGVVTDHTDEGLGLSEFAPGAWQRIVGRQPRVKLCWQHKLDSPIGVADLAVDSRGNLMARCRVATGTELGREALALVRLGAVNGLSTRVAPTKVRHETRGGRQVRVVQDGDLIELSLVTFPRDPAARVLYSDSTADWPVAAGYTGAVEVPFAAPAVPFDRTGEAMYRLTRAYQREAAAKR